MLSSNALLVNKSFLMKNKLRSMLDIKKVFIRYYFTIGKSTHFITQSVAIPIAFQCQIESFESI